jgi:hypothetical protein
MLFESSIEAWHAAFATAEGVQDPFSPRVSGGSRDGGMRGVREAESLKVAKAVQALADDLYSAGMYSYGPSDTKTFYQARDKLASILWGKFVSIAPDNALLSYTKTVRMTILITAVLEEGRAAACGESVLSDACVASRLGIDRSSFSRTWADSYRQLVQHMSERARTALTEIEPVVNEINRLYSRRRA